MTGAGPDRDVDETDDRPLPELPPLPADPRWRIEHLPMVTAAGVAIALCAASAGFFAGGPTAALGAAGGALVVLVGTTMSTLVIAWADTIRPALVLPVGLAVYVVKFALVAFLMISVWGSGWAGGLPMAWSLAGSAVALTAVQVWWLTRLANRHLPPASGVDAAVPDQRRGGVDRDARTGDARIR